MRVIYEPRGKAREYAPLAANIFTGGWNGGGCNNGCKYCYVCTMPGFRDRRGRPLRLRKGVLEQLEKDAQELAALGCQDEILLSFTHDPWPACGELPVDERFWSKPHPTVRVVEILNVHSLRWTTLTKRPTVAEWEAAHCFLAARGRVRFGVSLALIDAADAEWWEPKADSVDDRLHALAKFHEAGVATWVSLEPVLDPAQALELVRRYSDIVDEWKIGLANHVEKWPREAQRRYEAYWERYWQPARQGWLEDDFSWQAAFRIFGDDLARVLQQHARAWYIKESLRPYMPDGFPVVQT